MTPIVLAGVLLAGGLGGVAGPDDAVVAPATPAVSTPAVSTLTVGATVAAPKTHANRYWGLPNILGAATHGYPKALSAAQRHGYVQDPASSKRLPGLHLPGVHVRRGHLPKIAKMALTRSHGRWQVRARVSATGAIYGKRPKRALEEVAVVVTVRDTAATTNPSRQPILFRKVVWRTMDARSKQLRAAVHLGFPKSVDKMLTAMSASRRGRAITVNAVHVIDADGRRIAGRRTVDHVKSAALDLASARSGATQAFADRQGSLVSIVNNDQTQAPNGDDALSMAVNLVANPVSCMLTNGGSASDFAAFNITGMAFGETTEGFLEEAGGSQQAANEAPASADVTGAMAADYAEAVVEAALGATLDWTTVAFDAFEELIELWITGCNQNPSMYTVAVTDALGNATSVGYSLDSNYNDSNTTPSQGGIADAQTAYTYWNTPGFFFTESPNASTYISQAFLESNYSPGPQGVAFVDAPPRNGEGGSSGQNVVGSGGDAGLSLAASSGPTSYPQASTGGSKSTSYPVVDFTINWGAACSSMLGGALSYNAGGAVSGWTDNYTFNACSGWPTAPAAIAGAIPNAPTMLSATPGNGSLVATFTSPANPPQVAATSYLVTARASDGTTAGSCSPAPEWVDDYAQMNCTISGLSNGSTYALSAQASNAYGTSPLGNALSAAPGVNGVPGAPTNVYAYVSGDSVVIAWLPPTYDGGQPITAYTALVTWLIDDSLAGASSCTATPTSYLGTSVNGVPLLTCSVGAAPYGIGQVQVAATNSIGQGPWDWVTGAGTP